MSTSSDIRSVHFLLLTVDSDISITEHLFHVRAADYVSLTDEIMSTYTLFGHYWKSIIHAKYSFQ